MKKSFLSLSLLLSLIVIAIPSTSFCDDSKKPMLNTDLLKPKTISGELFQLITLKGLRPVVDSASNEYLTTAVDLYKEATKANLMQMIFAPVFNQSAEEVCRYKATHVVLNLLSQTKAVQELAEKTQLTKLNTIHPNATRAAKGVAAYFLSKLAARLYANVKVSGDTE